MAYDKVVDSAVLNDNLVAVADAIRAKGGTSDPLSFPTGFADAIAAIQTGGGGGGSEEEWIGDGNTHIWIHLAEGRTSPMLGCCPNGTVTVDWGDGTTPDTLTGTSVTSVKWTPTHHYAAAGDYVITLTVDGTMGFYGSYSYSQGSYILRYSSSNDNRSYGYRIAVKKIEIGDGVTSIGNYAFNSCGGLASIKIPGSVTSIAINAFENCYSLASITIPDSVTKIGGDAFRNCYNLVSVTIPDGVTSIESSAFYGCYSLASITIPGSVTSIAQSAFRVCYSLVSLTILDGVTSIEKNVFNGSYSMGKIRFESATPPTVSGSDAFTGVPTDCVISVPVGSLAAYTSATNYPDPATYTYIEED